MITEKEFYEKVGGNYTEALSRLMKDSLIHKFVLKYKNDPSFANLAAAVAARDWDSAFSCAHTMKGVVMNLAFSRLAGPTQELTDLLRPQNKDAFSEEKALELFALVELYYNELIAAIAELEA